MTEPATKAIQAEMAPQLEKLRPQLLKYATLQLRNAAWAEDAVSDTLLAALERPQSFAGQSQLKTWLIGILKHKLVDQIRRNSKEMSTTAEDGQDLDEDLFHPNGHWRETPQDWGDPEHCLRQLDFMRVLEACVEHLPGQQGRLFMMREWLELDTEEICKALDISATNLWVMLHRARLRLRECLQLNWFGARAPQTQEQGGAL
ncbi:RNA polymerase subunit sigma [Paucibacter sp. KBW04]|uniref:sigma-70 family RNA polymerase sigma factor n=1 Tax=Paucibacter sp. KBW04 TaxID=2153361 RepID=UPI000F55CE06|nr:sigma-70 family RNA polymerase sigma factor [Paucibacter sp. KBW04]RQO55308.1 RNA polymerase subunit sigma [Paucibacter sp. KBW04]